MSGPGPASYGGVVVDLSATTRRLVVLSPHFHRAFTASCPRRAGQASTLGRGGLQRESPLGGVGLCERVFLSSSATRTAIGGRSPARGTGPSPMDWRQTCVERG